MQLLDRLLSRSAERTPEAIALVAGDLRVSYAMLESRVARAANVMREAGVARGDRVTIALENSVEAVTALFGAMRAGAVAVPLHPAIKSGRYAQVLRNSEAKLAIVTQSRLNEAADGERAPADGGDFPTQTLSETAFEQALVGATERPLAPRRTDSDLGLLIYTSGSTGTPSGVMLQHRALRSSAWTISTYLENRADDVLLLLLPLSFGYGFTQLSTAFRVGAKVVLEKGFGLPFPIVQSIEQHRITGLAGVPTVFALLLSLRDLAERDLSSLRYLTNAGAGIAPALIAKIRAALPHVKFIPMYGQTECTRASYLPPHEVDRRPESVGIGMPNQDHWLVRDDGELAKPGEAGELVVRGSHLMLGYFREPEKSARALRPAPDGIGLALYTRDLFRTDADGFLYFVGRSDEILKSKGQKVAPKEVEDAILSFPGVALVAVVGVPDPIVGQAVTAVVVPSSGTKLNLRELQRHVAARVDDAAVPKYIDVVDELPKNERGKIDKLSVAAQACLRHPIRTQ